MVQRQRLASSLLILFFLVLAGLTFFSNTLQNFMLPKVTTEKSVMKTLTYRIEGSGVVVPREKTDLVSESGWKVVKVHVSNNEEVKKGQVLVTFNDSEAQKQLLDAEAELKKRNLSRETLKEQFITAQRTGDGETIRKAKRDLEMEQLDQGISERKMEQMRKDLSLKRVLTAPYDGKVMDLKAKEEIAVPQGQSVLTLVQTSEGFQFTFSIDSDLALLLQNNQKIDAEVKGDKNQRVEGTIVEIKDDASGTDNGGPLGTTNTTKETKSKKTIVVSVSDGNLQGGEQASVKMEKKGKNPGIVISKKLLKKDEQGSYVFTVRRNQSSLGNTFTVQKVYVSTGEENGDEIVVLDGLFPQEEIIAETSKPLQEGNRVRLN